MFRTNDEIVESARRTLHRISSVGEVDVRLMETRQDFSMVDDHNSQNQPRDGGNSTWNVHLTTQKTCLRTNTGRLSKGNAQQRTTTMKSK